MIYLWLSTPELAIQRVERRVKAGGHGVSEGIIRRRYERGRVNFAKFYAPLADTWEVYDNSGDRPYLVAFGGRNEPPMILASDGWRRIIEGTA